MTGIIFPNVMGTLAPLIQMDQAAQRNAFEMDRIRRQDKLDAEERDAAASLPAAIKGDPAAVAKVTASPKYALPFMQHIEKLDTNQRAKLKEQFEVTGKTAAGILALPEAEQPAAYESAYQNLTAQGYKINLPPKWSPALKNQLQGYAIQVPEYLKMLGDRPTPMGPASGGQVTATPDVKAKGAEYTNYLQTTHGLSPVAAAGIVGGLVQESGLDPSYGFTRPGGDNGTAFGMGQWRFDRAQGLQRFAQTQGKTPTDPTVQLDYLVSEMKGGDMGAQRAFAMLQQAKTPEEATTAMMHFFRPAGYTPANPQGGHGYAQRVQYAQQFGAGGPAAPTQDGSGNPTPPTDPADVAGLKAWVAKNFPGARPMGRGGKPIYDSQGKLMIQKADGSDEWVDVPKPQQPPSGYRPAGGGLEPIPGGPADPAQAKAIADAKRKAEEKATPQTVTKGMQENLTALKKIDAALEALADPKAKGSVGGVGGTVGAWLPGGSEFLNWVDPDGTKVRALIADIGSLKIHDRSGAAVTAAETPRLKPFIPSVGDSPRVIVDKLNNFRAEYEGMLRDSLDYYSEQNGFRPYTPAVDYLNRQPVPAGSPAPTPAPAPAPPQQAAPKAAPAPPQSAGPPRIGANGEGYDQIPPGAQYIAPDGTTRTKGGR